MKEPMHFVRKGLYDAINGNVSVDGSNVLIYNRVPTNKTYPYIHIYSLSTNEIDQNGSTFNTEIITRIECVSRFIGDNGGDLQANKIVSEVINLVRTRTSGYPDLSSDNLKIYTSTINNINYVQEDEDDHTYIKGIIELSNKVMEIN
jgi:hypothetical protein